MKKIIFILGTVIICSLFFFISFIFFFKRAVPLDLQQLITYYFAFPDSWDTGELPVKDIDWQIQEAGKQSQTMFNANSEIRITWSDKGCSSCTPKITLSAIEFKNIFSALCIYCEYKPEKIYDCKWPNFTFKPQQRGVLYPDLNDIIKLNLYTFNKHFVCALGNPNKVKDDRNYSKL